jgi:hypothetical protein
MLNSKSQVATLAEQAAATRSRRRKAGAYVTLAQQAAFAKYMQRGGEKNLNAEDCATLATHPLLRPVQREHFAALAATL